MPTAVGSQQFCKESRKRQGRIMFECNYSFFHHCLFFCSYVIFKKLYFDFWVNQNGGHKQWLGEVRPPWPPPPVATALRNTLMHFIYCNWLSRKQACQNVHRWDPKLWVSKFLCPCWKAFQLQRSRAKKYCTRRTLYLAPHQQRNYIIYLFRWYCW